MDDLAVLGSGERQVQEMAQEIRGWLHLPPGSRWEKQILGLARLEIKCRRLHEWLGSMPLEEQKAVSEAGAALSPLEIWWAAEAAAVRVREALGLTPASEHNRPQPEDGNAAANLLD